MDNTMTETTPATSFVKYQHLERFGTSEVDGIEMGTVYIFPKIDGTNASVWLAEDGTVQAGSRKRHLSVEDDNAGFCAWATNEPSIREYLLANPTHRLFGEWLVPHSLRTYREDAWRKFYVFDVATVKDTSELTHEGDSKLRYLHYEVYRPGLEAFGIDYIPPIATATNSNKEQLTEQLKKNVFLIEDGKGVGEGIVIKNYAFVNRFNRQTWAKIVTSEFKEKHVKTMGAPELKGRKQVEAEIANEYVTTALCEKVYAKIENEGGFTSRRIPQLLNTVFYDVVREDTWNYVKKHKMPTIDFSTLQKHVFAKVKERMPHLF